MCILPQRRTAKLTRELRSEAGRWLRELREKRGLSQRQLAQMVGAEHYTFISQLEHGWGRIPPDRYVVWADALGVDPRKLVQGQIGTARGDHVAGTLARRLRIVRK